MAAEECYRPAFFSSSFSPLSELPLSSWSCFSCFSELPAMPLCSGWVVFFCTKGESNTFWHPHCWKSNNTNARLMAFAPSLALDPTSGTHSHKTLDTAQPCHLLKPNWKPSSFHSISVLTNISTQFLLQSVCVCVFVVCLFFNNTLCKLFW